MKVFITGVSSGIGRELTKLLTAEGHEVWGVARRRDKLEELKKELHSDRFHFSQCDVADPGHVDQVVDEMKQKGFLPDVVVLNSAIFARDLTPDLDHGLARQAFSVNYHGAIIWVEKFLSDFWRRGQGRFIVISSAAALRPNAQSFSLSVSKAALAMAFRSLNLHFGSKNLNFVRVYLGPVATEIVPEYTTPEGRKKYFFVLTVEQTAKKLLKVIEGRRSVYYFPYWLLLLFRLGLYLPDKWFVRVSKKLTSK